MQLTSYSVLGPLLGIFILAVLGSSSADAQITWSSPRAIVSSTDITTIGVSVDAITANRFGNTLTIGDTTFKATSSDGTISLSGSFGTGGTDGSGSNSAPYNTVLDGCDYVSSGSTGTISLGSPGTPLIAGHIYQIEVWNAAVNGRPTLFSGASSVNLTGADLVVGTFVAPANGIQTFTFTSAISGSYGELNAIALRDISASSSAILWGAPQPMTGVPDIATNGVAVDAFEASAGKTTAYTINDTVFNVGDYTDGTISLSGPLGSGTAGSFTSSSPSSTAYANAVALCAFVGSGNTGTITLSSLTIGRQYQVQIWNSTSYPTTFSGINTVNLSGTDFALGTFTATSTSQSFTFTNPSSYAVVTDIALRDITPVIFHPTRAAGPGDVIGLQGDNFGSSPQVWMQHVVGTESSLSPQTKLQVLNSNPTSVTALIPTTETLGLYAIWIVNGGAKAGPIYINQACSWGTPDLAGTSVDPSRSFRLFGHNLLLSGATPSVRFVNGGTSLAGTVTTSGSDAYGLHVTAPTGLVAGTAYTVYVKNGLGGNYGETAMTYTLTAQASSGTDVFGLGVPWGGEFASIAANVYNVKTDSRLSQHAVGDGVTDDTAAIQNAIYTASGAGGGTVYLPTGTYAIKMPASTGNYVPINLANNVVLKGDGMDSTQLKMSGFDPTKYGFTYGAYACSHVGFVDLCLDNTSTGTGWNTAISSCTKTFAIRTKFLADVGNNAVWTNNVSSVVRNCNITNTQTSGTSFGQPTYFLGNTDTVFSNNTVSYYFARARMMESVRTLAENNTVTRTAITNGYTAESGGFDISDDQQLALLTNTLNRAGTGPFVDAGSGETIMSQNDGDSNEDDGVVTGATATTLTASTANWTFAYGTAESGFAGQGFYVAIVSGPGTGQSRRITSNTTTTLTISEPWSEKPGTASHFCIHHLQDQQALVEGNTLSQNPLGIELYSTSLLDVAIVNNSLTDNGGIEILAFGASPTDTYPGCDTVMDTLVTGNSVTSTTDLYHDEDSYARISIDANYSSNSGFGTLSFGTEFRNNTLNAPNPNTWNTDFPGRTNLAEGYGARCLLAGGQYVWSDNTTQGVIGTIFEGNTANQTTAAYHVCTGVYSTTIWNPIDTNVTSLLDDQAGPFGATHASVSTVTGSN